MPIKSLPIKNKSLTLNEVQCQFENWRETRTRKGIIPERLWDAAVSLAETCTINQIAKALHLNHTCLRDRIHVSKLQKNAEKEMPTFVELNIQQYNMKDCIVKMESKDGTKMEVQLNGCSASNLVEFCSSLWRRRS